MASKRSDNPVVMKYKHTRVTNTKNNARKDKNKQEKAARAEQISKKRNLSDVPPDACEDGNKMNLTNLTKAEKRKQELIRWKEKRDKERRIEKQKYKEKQFVVKHVNHSPAKFLKPAKVNNKNEIKAKKSVQSTTRTMSTRSMTKDINKSEKEIKSKDTEKCIAVPKKEKTKAKTNFNKKEKTVVTKNSEVANNEEANTEIIIEKREGGELALEMESPKSDCIVAPPGKTPKHLMSMRRVLNECDNDGFTPRRIKSSAQFNKLVKDEEQKFMKLIKYWNSVLSEDQLAEEVNGKIRTVIGQAQLLMDQRFKQFVGLVDVHQSKVAVKDVTATDLQGFWDMIFFQIEDVHKKFEDLEEQRERGWEEEKSVRKMTEKKKQPAETQDKPKAVKKESVNLRKEAMRKFKMEMKAKLKATNSTSNSNEVEVMQPQSEASAEPRTNPQDEFVFAKYLRPSVSDEENQTVKEIFQTPIKSANDGCFHSILDSTIDENIMQASL
eukprot:gene4579-5182_t